MSVCRNKNDQIPLAAKTPCYWSQDLGHFRNKDTSSEAMARGFLGDLGCSWNLSEWLNGLNYGFRVVAATTQFIKSYVNWAAKQLLLQWLLHVDSSQLASWLRVNRVANE